MNTVKDRLNKMLKMELNVYGSTCLFKALLFPGMCYNTIHTIYNTIQIDGMSISGHTIEKNIKL